MFNAVVPYLYLLPNLYLSDIANPYLFVCVVVGPGLVSTSPVFIRRIARQPSSGSAWPACPKKGNRAGWVDTFCTGFPD